MKTRYKIALVIACFASFYFALIPALQICSDSGGDCTVWQELLLLTRPVISSSEGIKWSGTVDGMDSPSASEQIIHNMPFAVSMIVLPFVIIGFVVVWDKKK